MQYIKNAILMYNKKGDDCMFRIRKTEETVNRTFRFPKSLIDKMSVISQSESISLNSLVIQCCEYALEQMDNGDKDANGQTLPLN